MFKKEVTPLSDAMISRIGKSINKLEHVAEKPAPAPEPVEAPVAVEPVEVQEAYKEELEEAKNYEIKDGKIHISKANFRKVHKDYKNATKGKERMMALDPKSGATTSFQVVFTEEKEDTLDPVNPKAVKKKFDDRKDKDIDNDGDIDSSDEYLHKRRKAISKALESKKPNASVDESAELEGLDENFRVLATKGMGAEGKNDIKVGTGVDFYEPKQGNKRQGTITKMSAGGYEVKDDDDGKTYKFKYHDRKKAKALLGEEAELDEAYMSAEEKSAFEDGKKAAKAGKNYKDNPNKDAKLKLAWSKGHNSYRVNKSRIREEAENLEELTAAEKKLIDQMYDKKGNLTPLGKKVMDHGKSTRKEEVELDEAKDDYTINHKTFSSAVQHAKDQVEKRGFTVDGDEWDRKVAMGPRKPGKGKTNRYTIDLMKGGKEARNKLQMQVYYDEGRYELNMYVS